LKFTVVLHIGQPVKIVVAEPDRVIVAEQMAVAAEKFEQFAQAKGVDYVQ